MKTKNPVFEISGTENGKIEMDVVYFFEPMGAKVKISKGTSPNGCNHDFVSWSIAKEDARALWARLKREGFYSNNRPMA